MAGLPKWKPSKADGPDGRRVHPKVLDARITQGVYKDTALRDSQSPEPKHETDALPKINGDQGPCGAKEALCYRVVSPIDRQGLHPVPPLQDRSPDEGRSHSQNCIAVDYRPLEWGGGRYARRQERNDIRPYVMSRIYQGTLLQDTFREDWRRLLPHRS